jgi:hypothetical protein
MSTLTTDRKQILLRIASKSHQMLDDIVLLTMRIKATQPAVYRTLDETPLWASHDPELNTSDLEDYRHTLEAQLK